MTLPYSLNITSEGEGSLTYYEGGALQTVPSEHPAFSEIVAALVRGESPARFVSLSAALADSALVEADDVELLDDVVYYKGEAVHSNLANTIVRYAREGRDTANLERFLANLDANPSHRSREQLFTWVNAKDLTIDEDGFIVGFKGVRQDVPDYVVVDDDDDYVDHDERFVSVHAGTASVDGVLYEDQRIPQWPGAVVSMDRSKVSDDPAEPCHEGLHVGNYRYASSWTSNVVVLEVRVNPADVVSIPSDSSCEKMRCCRYEVLQVHVPVPEAPEEDLSSYEPEATIPPANLAEALVNVPRSFLAGLLHRLGR